jgi:hypothetical protein
MPGVMRTLPGGITPKILHDDVEKAKSYMSKFRDDPQVAKMMKNWQPVDYSNHNNAAIADYVEKQLRASVGMGGEIEYNGLMHEIERNIRVATPQGTKALLTLPKAEVETYRAVINNTIETLMKKEAAGAGGGPATIGAYGDQRLAGPPAPTATAAPVATPTAAPGIGSVGKQVPGGSYARGGQAPPPIPLPAGPTRPRQSGVPAGAIPQRLGR